MDTLLAGISGGSELLEHSLELQNWSRNQCLEEFASFSKMCQLYHELRETVYSEGMNELAVAFANVLLKQPEFRAQVLVQNPELAEDVQRRLEQDSVSSEGFKVEWEVPLWRVLFLLAHGHAEGSRGFEVFSRDLAPNKFQHLAEKLADTGQQSDKLPVVFEELGKYWYALCYNYGSLVVTYGVHFWRSLESFTTSLRANRGRLLGDYASALLQLCSLLLLFPENNLLATFDMVLNLTLILKHGIIAWSEKVSEELYSSPQDYKIPQILHVILIFVSKSPYVVRKRIQPCFSGEEGCSVNLRKQVLDMQSSKLLCSDTRETLDGILSVLGLTVCVNDDGQLDIIHMVQSQPLSTRGSTETFYDQQHSQSSSRLSDLSSSGTTLRNSLDGDFDDTWSEEDKIAEADRLVAAIRRLDELGIIKPTFPGQ
ncbi:LAQU0S02e06722g1_1 [Lachancea quebecensis]|uniref:LAQU0S02e06722g1_1 n=1 Tax=Lachancea quebecensis TaxID=1654605 RepID=A0A0P1KNJ6_9SACH|nr:LAQU0S02e06722g1_1 [Lachancea quebecensis]